MTAYVSTDIDIATSARPDSLIQELGKVADFVPRKALMDGECYFGSFQRKFPITTPDADVLEFCLALRGLSLKARAEWINCVVRNVAVSVLSGGRMPSRSWALQPDTVKEIADLQATVTLVVHCS